jgi:hypothetical protein
VSPLPPVDADPTSPDATAILFFRARRRLRRLVAARPDPASYAPLTVAEFTERTGVPKGSNPPPNSASLIALPGAPSWKPGVPSERVITAAHELLEHRFDILGSGPRSLAAPENVRRSQRFHDLAAELPASAVRAYKPIEWHSDFVRGHRWDPDVPFTAVRVAAVAGADIKVPRELSRFQHVGTLARAGEERHALEFALQALDWISANPVGRGVNWASAMDVAIRAVNWIWGLRLFEHLARYPATTWEIRRSLCEHGRYLSEQLEYYEECTTNHYMADIAGLLYIGAACAEFPEADTWLHLGIQELVSEIWRQVYSDGADYEGSSHYHRLVAETFLSCAALAERIPDARRDRLSRVPMAARRRPPRLRPLADQDISLRTKGRLLPAAFYTRLARMIDYTAALTKPNGLVPQVGDNDSGRLHRLSPDPHEDVRDHRHLLAVGGELLGREDLSALAANQRDEAQLVAGDLPIAPATRASVPLRGPLVLFPKTGVAVRRTDSAYLLVTCGPNGQHGRGGHNHNDKGSFELNVRDHDVVVDGGCYVYTSAPDTRNQFRSTAAHSTVWVAGCEQDEWPEGLGGLFSLPERSHPVLRVSAEGTVIAEHRGFRAPHRRTFEVAAGTLTIVDELQLRDPAYIGFNFDPAVQVSIDGENAAGGVRLGVGGLMVRIAIEGASDYRVEPGFFSRGYGVRVPNKRLVARLTAPTATTRITWPAP